MLSEWGLTNTAAIACDTTDPNAANDTVTHIATVPGAHVTGSGSLFKFR